MTVKESRKTVADSTKMLANVLIKLHKVHLRLLMHF